VAAAEAAGDAAVEFDRLLLQAIDRLRLAQARAPG
jgi:hypothetical protein